MKSFGQINRAWVLAIALGLTGTSCMMQKGLVFRKGGTQPSLISNSQIDKPTTKEPVATTKAALQAVYGKLPLHFEANHGQTDERVDFLSRGHGYTLFLASSEAVLSLQQKPAVWSQNSEGRTHPLTPSDSGLVLRMQLIGADPHPKVAGLEELPGKVNYFIGNDPASWHAGIPTYAKVKYQDVYPGVDLVYYGSQQTVEYDFVVAPGADPSIIRLAFDGLGGAINEAPVQIADNGDLIFHTDSGEVRCNESSSITGNGTKRFWSP